MMVEKESGQISRTEFETLWSKVTMGDGRIRYMLQASNFSTYKERLTFFFISDTKMQ